MRATLEIITEFFVRITPYWRGMRTALCRKNRRCICVPLGIFCRERRKRFDMLFAAVFSVGAKRKVEVGDV